MKKILLAVLLASSVLFADYTKMKISDYVNIVATQNRINIATDNYIKKDFDFYINKPIGGSTNLKVLKELLDSNGFTLVKKSKDYYIIKNKKDLLINKIKIFSVKYADTKLLKEKCDKILMGYYRNIKTTITSNRKKIFTPMQEQKPAANESKMNIKETQTRINYSINVLDNKTIAVNYKDNFVPGIVSTIIEAIDHKPKIIRVTCKIYEVSTTALKNLGAELSMNGALGIKINDFSTSTQNGIVKLNAALGADTTNLNTLGINAVITALEKKGDAKLKSEPSVLLYEGKSSKLTQGKSFPIQQQNTQVNNTASTSTTTYTQQDTGLTLGIKFNQFRSGLIYLDFKLNILGVDTYDRQTQQLITFKRQLVNNMIITPGQQIDIAGLNTHNRTKSTGGIPLLKDIPYLGRLFQFSNKNQEDTMLIIQLKAELLK
jgi:general secretion pathway protein D